MRVLAFLAVAALALSVASVPIIGGAVFALFLFFPLFLLALLGVLAGVEDHSVRQRNPSMDATAWRAGSQAATSELQSPAAPSVGHEGSRLRDAKRRAA